MAIGSANDNKIVLELQVGGQGGGLSENDRQLLNDFKENTENILKKTESDDILLANGETLSREELKGDKGDTGERGQRGERGLQGEQGIQGVDGKSAYHIWLDIGNQGSEQDFLNWLQGEGLTEEEKQQLIKKGATKDILLEDGTTITKEELLSNDIDIQPSDYEVRVFENKIQFKLKTTNTWTDLPTQPENPSGKTLSARIHNKFIQFKFDDEGKWLPLYLVEDLAYELRFASLHIQWKLRSEASHLWKNILYNYNVRELDHQVLTAKIEGETIKIKLQSEGDDKWRDLLLGHSYNFNIRFLENHIEWKSNDPNSQWYKFPLNPDASKNGKTYVAKLNQNKIEIRETSGVSFEVLPLVFSENFNIQIKDQRLEWKELTEDDLKWKWIPFRSENYHTKDTLDCRIHFGVIQYKFPLQEQWSDLIPLKDLIKVEQKVISEKDIVGDTLNYLRALTTVQDNVLLRAGLYKVNPVSSYGISLLSNSKFHLENGATIKVNPCTLPTFYLFNLRKVNNVEISGGQLIGDKEEHLYHNSIDDNRYRREEHIHGINIDECRDIKIFDMKIDKFIGDCIQIPYAENIYCRNLHLVGSRMENLGLRHGKNFIFENCNLDFASPDSKSKFTNLGYGVDIEPHLAIKGKGLENIKFLNCTFKHNKGFMPVGAMISLYGLKRQGATTPEPANVTISFINPVFEGCGLVAASANDLANGFLYIENATFIETQWFGLLFRDNVSANFKTYVKGARFIDCGTDVASASGYYSQFIAPISFWVNSNEYQKGEVELNRGTRNIFMSDIEIINTDKGKFRQFAIQNYVTTNSTNTKLNDLQNVEITNLKVVGYEKIFHNQTGQMIDPTFKITYSNETQVTEIINDFIVTKDTNNHVFNVTSASNVTFKEDIHSSNIEYYAKNSSQGEVKLKFETPTDIEGLAYGIQEFALARGKRIKMRKIDTNRWEYLEGTA
ncbi:hypothetical protein [Capnocytophaga cynodegmi]|uniref:Uncharacterized protein n=1 Tax=Capnocytophaga cynodegmi TaxID=28189 RepID=A0A0B7H8L2_9FLAO|nr:hypothetical protein [Capnocytophaga cynodegmi]CEN34879.1 hypothetical protein CCYN2B_240009 [Capnocytophaga cynodegmi]